MIFDFLKYGIGGGLAFVLNLALTYFFTEILRFYYLISAFLGYLISIFINFSFQAFITFKTKEERFFKRFVLFLLIQINASLLHTFLVYIFTDLLKIYYLISVALSSFILWMINFGLSKKIIFKK